VDKSAFAQCLPVHHRCHPGAGRPEACPAPADWGTQDTRIDEKLARRIEHGTARIVTATVSQTADRWHVSFTCEVQPRLPTSNSKDAVVGVDVGIRYLAVLSTRTIIANPRALERSLRKLRRLNRELHRRRPRSRRCNHTRRRLARVHARAANLRRDALHKLTTTLATQHDVVVIESLNLAGMVRNRRLARVLADVGLAERNFTCDACGLRIDRDLNAAAISPGSQNTSPRVAGRRERPVEPTVSPSLLGRRPRNGNPAAR
jgi:transposase